ncbi:MAG TPA: hypothetical protein VGQ12_04225 [Candidatus Angelobacter sp.]|jgi:hypothetical protein|nr:hypothetical protein [Candidatus Angelobacter sp.]
MGNSLLYFDVIDLDVSVEEGVKLNWQGREIDTGPLAIRLGAPGSSGVIDYEAGTVKVEFRIQLSFPALDELFDILKDMGAERGVTAAFGGVIRSQGAVFEDHSLRLSGQGELAEHRLFTPAEMRLDIRAPSE